MTASVLSLTLIALDELDAAAWAVDCPELVPAVAVVLVDDVPALEHSAVGELIVTERVSELNAASGHGALVAWVIAHIRHLWDTDPTPSSVVRELADRDAL